MIIKKLLPFENLTYKSTLSKDELINHLKNEIEKKRPVEFGTYKQLYSKPYHGMVSGDTFEIQRTISYKNSFLPQIHGEVADAVNGSKINVKMKLPMLVKGFMLIWFTGALAGTAFSLYLSWNNFDDGSVFSYLPFLMLPFGAILVYFGFKTESKRTIRDLEEILKAKR